MDAQSVLLIIGGSIAIIVAIGGLVATIWAIGRVRGVEQSIGLLNIANEGLREANNDLRFDLTRSERDCGERVTKLEAQIAALTDGLGQRLADSIATHLTPALTLALNQIVDGIAQRSEDRKGRFTEGGNQ